MATHVEHVGGTLGNLGTPGAPILHFNLAVTRSTGGHGASPVSGTANITQAIASMAGNVTIGGLSGRAYAHGPHGLVIVLTGSFNIPPNELVEHFEAVMVVQELNGQWSGAGSYIYTQPVVDVPVHAKVLLLA